MEDDDLWSLEEITVLWAGPRIGGGLAWEAIPWQSGLLVGSHVGYGIRGSRVGSGA
jgi:hypothetical protein